MKLSRAFGFCAAASVSASAGSQNVLQRQDGTAPLVQPVYRTFPLGSVKPLGWMRDQLELAADGLAGHMFEFYRFVHDSRWLGGTTEYSILDEASPYWFNGVVPLAFALDDERILSQVRYYLDYVLDHQQADGWLGFETTRQSRGLWARCLLLLGLMQYAEADPSQTERIVDAMHRYVDLAHSMLRDNYTGLIVHGDDTFDPSGFGVGRTHEMHIPLQWLLEKYPRNNSRVLWETMELMIDGGVVWGADWRKFWVEGVYPETFYDGVTPWNMSWVFLHGVNHAEGLRYPLSIYRMTHRSELKEQTRTAIDLVARWHKSVAGTIIADEYISDLSPFKGAELCIAAEVMFSLAYIYQFLADNDVADWVEQAAFNAFPASVSADWWSHQYVQQLNQPWSRNLTEGAALWLDVNSYSNVFGLEPNYPCCTVNHPQAYPKYLANSFMLTEDGGIVHVFLGPGNLTTALDGGTVSIVTKTKYPFDLSLEYTITTDKAFDFYVRIPGWADISSSSVTRRLSAQGGGEKVAVHPSEQGLQRLSVPAGGERLVLNLATLPRVETLANNTAAIFYGPLLYSLAIEYRTAAGPPLDYRTQRVLNANTTQKHTHDHVIVPTSVWNVAIDPSQIQLVYAETSASSPFAASSPLLNPIWEQGAPPPELRVAAVEIDWPLAHDSPANPPTKPVMTGKPFSARFVPYGSAKIHMAVMPVVSLPKVKLQALWP